MTDRRSPTSHPIRELLAHFDGLYQQQAGHKYPFTGKDAKLAQELREFYSDDEIKSFMDTFFRVDDEFILNAGHSFGVFRSCLPKLMAWARRGNRPAQVGPKRKLLPWERESA